ncbi:hypothetical protein BLNAU_20372 [Blattamonas nauphoetae]|uniref:Uncharacterized protein n=1 Tax=Blattamonas nauphoetae TaxID=2049346 RepID=A0ABQ9X010_9EUKA|nr:hypothetical protein BLNAU_20372 [Blattamonas nauphoetae]
MGVSKVHFRTICGNDLAHFNRLLSSLSLIPPHPSLSIPLFSIRLPSSFRAHPSPSILSIPLFLNRCPRHPAPSLHRSIIHPIFSIDCPRRSRSSLPIDPVHLSSSLPIDPVHPALFSID